MEKFNFEKNIIEAIDMYVQWLAKKGWEKDDCPPKFIVSLNNQDINKQSIMITIDHLGSRFTETLFPQDMRYGYDSIYSQMENMYNRTM